MNIGIIFYGIYPFNRGIDQLTQILKHLGYYPEIVARFSGHGEMINRIHGVPLIQIPLQSGSLLKDLTLFHFPFNMFWRNLLVELGYNRKWDAIIVRETPLAWPVISAAMRLGIPAYLDMREDLAAMYRMGKAKNLLLMVFRWPIFIKMYEKTTIKGFKHVYTVSEEMKKWLLETYPIVGRKVSVLENTPSEQFLKYAKQALAKNIKNENVIRLVYAGVIKETKGVGDIVYSLPYILSENHNIRLRIIGDGPYLEALKKTVNKLGLQSIVEFVPMLSMSELASMISQCDIGLELCRLNDLTHKTIPGKLFEYMALELPVLSSARRSVMRIIGEAGCGEIYYSRKPQHIARTLLNMIADYEKLKKMGTNGRNAVLNRHNWKNNLNILSESLDMNFKKH